MGKKVDLDHQPLTVWVEDKEIKKEEKSLGGNEGKRGCKRKKEGKRFEEYFGKKEEREKMEKEWGE